MNRLAGAFANATGRFRMLRGALYWGVVALIAFLVWDRVAEAWRIATTHSTGMVGFALAAAFVSTISFAFAWQCHIGLPDGHLVAADYLTSNVAKYLPLGSAVQYARQSYRVGTRGGSIRDGALGSLRFILMVIGVGGAATAVFSVVARTWVVAGLGLLLSPLAWTGVQDRLLALVPRLKAGPVPGRYSPRRLWALTWLTVGVVAFGISFALLVLATDVGGDFIRLANTGIASWLAGYVALPIPSGVGVREVVVGFLSNQSPVESLVAATLLHRGVGAVGDVLALLLVPILHRRRSVESEGR